jgi:gamma-glutamylcyclotransferase (GGCT)/AIG2-like uncharacterized protein YtfP
MTGWVPANGPGDRAERLHRALNYPYHWPGACYLYCDGEAHPVDERAARRESRTPVLAFGSNRSPDQLQRKFGALDAASAILVEECVIDGFDVVHAARFTSYAALPAAMVPAPGVRVRVAVTWLDADQLEHMDLTEAVGVNYRRERIGVPAELPDGSRIDHAEFYRTTHEPLRLDGEVVAHGAIAAEGRTGPALGNRELLEIAHATHAPEIDLEGFLLRLGEDDAYRAGLSARLKAGLRRTR